MKKNVLSANITANVQNHVGSGKASAEEAAIAKTVSHEIEPLVQEQRSRSRRARKPKQHAEARTRLVKEQVTAQPRLA